MLYINNLKEEKSILLLKNEAILAAVDEAPGQADIFGGEIEGPDIAFVPRQIGGPRPGDQA